jgi:hypothetical protein
MKPLGRTWFSATAFGLAVACGSAFHGTEGAAGKSADAGPDTAGAPGGGTGGNAGTTSDGGSGGANVQGSGGAGGATRTEDAGSDAGKVVGTGGADAGAPDGGESEGGPAAPTYRDAILHDQPRAYWRMSIKSGRTVPDETGGGNSLVLQGSGQTLGVEGAVRDDDGAMGFDGAASYAIATNARMLDFSNGAAFTLECWARRRSGGASYFQHVFSNVEGSAGSRNGYLLYLLPEPSGQDSPRSVFEYDQPAADLGVWGPLPKESVWAHYVAVYDGGRASLYVDATLAENVPVTGSITARTGTFSVGRGADVDGFYFKGDLDELAVYPRALALTDITRHFAFGK